MVGGELSEFPGVCMWGLLMGWAEPSYVSLKGYVSREGRKGRKGFLKWGEAEKGGVVRAGRIIAHEGTKTRRHEDFLGEVRWKKYGVGRFLR